MEFLLVIIFVCGVVSGIYLCSQILEKINNKIK